MALDFNGINIGGNNGGGGGSPYVLPTASTTTLGGVKIDDETIKISESGVISSPVDDTLSDTSENPVQNKILYPAVSKFIPADTNITVELDGSGDFTTLADALEYIKGKYSNGIVVIKLGDGTFTLSSEVGINTTYFNFALLQIVGNGTAKTTVQGTSTHYLNFTRYGTPVLLTDINFTTTDGSKDNTASAIVNRLGSKMHVYKCNFTGGGVYAYRNSPLQTEAVSFTNVGIPIRAQSGSVVVATSTHTFNNVNWAFGIRLGGTIALNNCACSFTNTNHKFGLLDSATVYSPSAGGTFYQGYDGIIMGKFTES